MTHDSCEMWAEVSLVNIMPELLLSVVKFSCPLVFTKMLIMVAKKYQNLEYNSFWFEFCSCWIVETVQVIKHESVSGNFLNVLCYEMV